MYRDFNEDKLNYLKSLTEAGLGIPDMENLSTLSNPALDIYNWDGKGEMPTTIKSSELDSISKKIAAQYDGDLSKTEFNEMFDRVFGDGTKTEYAPYDSLGDYSYRDTLVETEVQNTTRIQKLQQLALQEAEDDNIAEENLNKLSTDAEDLKATREEDEDEDDDDDDDDTLKEGYGYFDLEEDYFDEDLADSYVEESEDYLDQSPISLLEDSEDEIVNLNTLLEQTQLIEDEVDSILGYDELSENSEDFSDVISESDNILYEEYDEMLDESSEIDSDLSDYLDEDIL